MINSSELAADQGVLMHKAPFQPNNGSTVSPIAAIQTSGKRRYLPIEVTDVMVVEVSHQYHHKQTELTGSNQEEHLKED